jgi:hypothetical protein
VALAPVDCLHKEMHRHRDSFSLEFVIYSNKTNILLVGMALQDVLICVRDREVSPDLENKAFSRSFIYREYNG